MQAIITKVLPATQTKPTRIQAKCASGITLTLSKNYIQDMAEIPFPRNEYYTEDASNHRKVAFELCKKLNWRIKNIHTGNLANDDHVHVLTF